MKRRSFYFQAACFHWHPKNTIQSNALGTTLRKVPAFTIVMDLDIPYIHTKEFIRLWSTEMENIPEKNLKHSFH